MPLICSHYYRNNHNAQTDTHTHSLTRCHDHETLPLVMLGDGVRARVGRDVASHYFHRMENHWKGICLFVEAGGRKKKKTAAKWRRNEY